MNPLSLFFGSVVGLSLGLTGGGGAIFAVPMLVYGLGVPAREAVGISLAAVGTTSFVGFLRRWKLGEAELRTGFMFAGAGMLGAPLGTWFAGRIPEALLLLAFAALMLVVAYRMWRQTTQARAATLPCSTSDTGTGTGNGAGPTCQRDSAGLLILTSRCAWLLLAVGFATGVLSGLFGVGGGFVIVPALVLFSGMSIHRAVGTSLLVIALVSVSGVASQMWSGQAISWELAAPFVAGGIAGLWAGQSVGRRVSGPILQRVFVVAMVAVALFVITRNLLA